MFVVLRDPVVGDLKLIFVTSHFVLPSLLSFLPPLS